MFQTTIKPESLTIKFKKKENKEFVDLLQIKKPTICRLAHYQKNFF